MDNELSGETSVTDAYREAQRRISLAKREGRRHLDLSALRLTSLPPEIGQLVELQELVLRSNQLMSLPPEIGQLVALTTLDLCLNLLTSLPPEIGQLVALEHLHLHMNELTALPWEIWQLVRLESLLLASNQLTSLPPEVGRVTQLIVLDLSDNQLGGLPVEIRSIPKECTLFLHGNPQLRIPKSVLGPSYDEWVVNAETAPKAGPILDYYFRTKLPTERRPLCEGKLILVGRGDVGKTSLVRRLVENKFSRREDTTQGIRIRDWDLKVGKKKELVRLHVWDFGGQEIMHATHQCFLTDRSLYLLVLDGRADQHEAEADYWLRLIAGIAPDSPVIVVLNKIKKNPFDLNRNALQQKYPSVRGFIETDCDHPGKDGKPGEHGFGIDKLEREIATQLDQLPEIRQMFPASWFAIKDKLSRMRKNFLTLAEYRQLCTKLKEPDEESQNNLSLFLHRLGIALNYSDDPRLNDRHVLNPHWLTAGIYRLLTSPTFAKRKGMLHLRDLAQELPAKDYPREMHPFLLRVMEKFELCFSFPGDEQYLIPELLDPQQPEAATKFEPTKCLNFRYLYPVVPPGLLPRFIVRTHVLSDLSQQDRWRTGVILSFEGNRALIKADAADKTVQVLIDGPPAGRPRMLAVIRQDFDTIHRDIPHLKPQELVAFPNQPQITVPYEELEVLYRNGPTTPVVRVVEGKVVSHTAGELLEGVEFGLSETRATKQGGKKFSPRELVLEPGAKRLSSNEPVRVFYSYSHLNAKERQRLSKHLAPLERFGLIRTWYDNEILPGAQFDQAIADKLDEAEIILLLVSPEFADSDYCHDIEMRRALERHLEEADDVAVLPVVIKPMHGWKQLGNGTITLGKLNALPAGGKAVPDWQGHDKGWASVAAGVESVAREVRNRRK